MFDQVSNWGRWGADDVLGTLNLVTPAKRLAAAAAVMTGQTVSLSRTVTPAYEAGNSNPPIHFMIASGVGAPEQGMAVAADWYGIAPHGHALTHLDSLGHLFWNARMYNGRPASRVEQVTGARDGSIEDAGGGIVTRGVLLDLPRALGLEYLEPEHRVSPSELESAEVAAGVTIEPGDAVLVRVGRDVDRAQRGPHDPDRSGTPGLSARCAEWFRERDVALLGSDVAHDPLPSIYRLMEMPIHVLCLVSMGLWLLDNAYLEDLADVVSAEGRSSFLLMLGPLKLKRGTGSAVNPLVLF
jgi:kynurenine formamidase